MSGSLELVASLSVVQEISKHTKPAGDEPVLLRDSHTSQQKEVGEK